MGLFDRKPTIELTPDTEWLIRQIVTHLESTGMMIVTDASLKEVEDAVSGKGHKTHLEVLKPDNLVDDLMALIAERAEQKQSFEQ
jgi:hypothetical protein